MICNSGTTHTSYRWGGERVIEPIQWMGIFRRPWLIKVNGGILVQECHGIFNDHRESGPCFRMVLFDRIVSPSLYWGVRTHTDHRVNSAPCWPHPGFPRSLPSWYWQVIWLLTVMMPLLIGFCFSLSSVHKISNYIQN